MPFTHIGVQHEDAMAIVTIDRSSALNALNATVLTELDACFAELSERQDVRVVILTGAGPKAFVAGADIAEMKGFGAAQAKALSERGQRVFTRIENLEKPVIAAINGFALGGGCELALAATFRIAARNARLGLPEVKLGLLPGYGGTQRLPRLVGRSRALELMLTGEMIGAERALEIGLVDRVVEPGELLDTCRTLARAIIAAAPLAVRGVLAAVRQGADVALDAGLAAETEAFIELFGTSDAAEGITAFLEKRPPAFRGR